MSSLLDLHLDEVEDPTVVPGGEEYQMRITSAQVAPSKSSDRDVIKVSCSIVDNPTAKTVFINMALPLKDDEKSTAYMLKLQVKQFMEAFGLDLSNPGEASEWKGLEAWAVLKTRSNEKTGDEENQVARWVKAA